MPHKKFKLLSVSTKTGDAGTTSLASGKRLPKSDPIFEIIGTIDELNSWLGLIAAKFEQEFDSHKNFLMSVQDTLFYIGGELADAKQVRLTAAQLTKLEKESEALQEKMSEGWHSRFLLPGGTELGGILDISRTVCRRTERLVVLHAEETEIRPVILQYLNRLSDYLYVLRCYVNHQVEYQEHEFVRKPEK